MHLSRVATAMLKCNIIHMCVCLSVCVYVFECVCVCVCVCVRAAGMVACVRQIIYTYVQVVPVLSDWI